MINDRIDEVDHILSSIRFYHGSLCPREEMIYSKAEEREIKSISYLHC